MEKNRKKQIVVLSIALVCIFILVFSLFHKSATKDSANPPLTNVLTDSISQIVSACPGEIGVAVIVNNRDTVKVNNKSVYPMMSVFKVHQALALCNDFDNKGISLDTLVNINNVSSMNLEQSKLCVNSPLYIDTRLLWEQTIGSNSTQ